MEEYIIRLQGIFGKDITLEGFRAELQAAAGKDLSIEISSDGGNPEVGGAMQNALKDYMQKNNAKVTFDMIGWVQSTASYFVMVKGVRRIAHPNTLWMHHNPHSGDFGDHVKLSKTASILMRLAQTYAQAYSAVSGKSETVILAEMQAETFLIGQEIVNAGFADEMSEDVGLSAVACGRDSLIQMGKNNIQKVSHVLQVAAFGGQPDEIVTQPSPQPGENDKALEAEMADQKKNENEIKAVEKRAESFGAAMAAMPEDAKSLTEAFQAGKGAEYFEGLTAHSAQMKSKAEAKVEADKLAAHNAANGGKGEKGAEGSGDGNPPPIDGDGTGLQANMKATGLSGGTIEV